MRFAQPVIALAVIVSIGLPFTGAHAQDASTMSLNGPAVSGVCMLSRVAVFAHAKVGQAASARLKQLADQAQSDVDAERKPIDADVQAYRAQAASLSAEQRQSREQALAQRVQKVQADQSLRARELEATRAKAMDRIAQAAQPVIASVYASKHCGLLLDRSAVMGGNMSNDLTEAVVQGLDAKLGTITFTMETLPAGTAASGTP